MTFQVRLHQLARAAVLCCTVLTVCLSPSLGQESSDLRGFSSPIGDLSLLYPADFETRPAEDPSVLLLLRRQDGSYPSFNLIVQSGPFALDPGSLQKQSSRILDQYHAVGLSDARLLRADLVDLNGQPAFEAELEYSSKSSIFKAFITILPSSEHHYILTFIDHSTPSQSLQRLRSELLGSVRFSPASVASTHVPDRKWRAWYLGGFICLLLLLIAAIRKTVLRQKKNRHA